MGSDGLLAAIHPDDLIQLREQVKPMGNQQHNAVRSQLFEIGKNLCLGVSVQCREGIIQHQNRALMTESPGKTQSLPLTAGQPDAAAAHQSFDAILHGGNLSIQADVPEIFPGSG